MSTEPQRAETITVTTTPTPPVAETKTDTAQTSAAAGVDWIEATWYAMGGSYALMAAAVVVLELTANALAVAALLLVIAVYSAAFGRWSR